MKSLKEIFGAAKDFFGENNEFIESTQGAVKDRLTSPFYGYFIFVWLLVNWKFLYISLLVSQDKIFEKTGLLRHEYLASLIPKGWGGWWCFVLFPFLLTIFIFWILPYGTRIFFRKDIRNKKALRIIELQEDKAEKVERQGVVQEEVRLLSKQEELANKQRSLKSKSPEILWEGEYNVMKKTSWVNELKKLYELIYQDDGYTVDGNGKSNVDSALLAYAHSNGLIEYTKSDRYDSRLVVLTEKGKYFIKLYLQGINPEFASF
jgi:hypothetical protein